MFQCSRLYPASVLPCPPSHEPLGADIQPAGIQNSLGGGKQCLQQSALMVQSRIPSWLGWQLSKEVRQFSAPLQTHKTCCHARLASSFPAQLFCPHHQHCLQLCQLPCLLAHQLGSCSHQLCPGYTREGGWAVQERAPCGCDRQGSCSLTPSSRGPPGETPSC